MVSFESLSLSLRGCKEFIDLFWRREGGAAWPHLANYLLRSTNGDYVLRSGTFRVKSNFVRKVVWSITTATDAAKKSVITGVLVMGNVLTSERGKRDLQTASVDSAVAVLPQKGSIE